MELEEDLNSVVAPGAQNSELEPRTSGEYTAPLTGIRSGRAPNRRQTPPGPKTLTSLYPLTREAPRREDVRDRTNRKPFATPFASLSRLAKGVANYGADRVMCPHSNLEKNRIAGRCPYEGFSRPWREYPSRRSLSHARV
jgi:hypothetical protein